MAELSVREELPVQAVFRSLVFGLLHRQGPDLRIANKQAWRDTFFKSAVSAEIFGHKNESLP